MSRALLLVLLLAGAVCAAPPACLVLTEAETAASGLAPRRTHLVVCVDDVGQVGGVVVSRRGRLRCDVQGEFDVDGCLTLTLCGATVRACDP